jgi:outer membrane protein assembly factor BamB
VCAGLAASADGTVFTSPGALHAIDARTGEERWKALTFAGAPLVHEDVVVVAGLGRLYALELATGAQRWAEPSPESEAMVKFGSRLAVGGGVVVARANDGSVRAADLATGAPRWRTSPAGCDMGRAPVTIIGACAVFVEFVSMDRAEVVALDLATGVERWRLRAVPEDFMDGAHWYSPVVPVVSKDGQALEALAAPTRRGFLLLRP